MPFNDVEKFVWTSPSPALAASQACDFNLKTSEKVPNAAAPRAASVSAAELLSADRPEGSAHAKAATRRHVSEAAAHHLESVRMLKGHFATNSSLWSCVSVSAFSPGGGEKPIC